MLGADKVLSEQSSLGVALSQGDGDLTLTGPGGGRGEADLTFVGVHARTGRGPFYLKGAIAYGQSKSTIDRAVAISGIFLTLATCLRPVRTMIRSNGPLWPVLCNSSSYKDEATASG